MGRYIPYMYEPYRLYSWRADHEITMAIVAEYMLQSVIYLYPSVESAQEGKKVGGSGFIVGIKSSVKGHHPYAVTNKHVIKGCGSKIVIRVNKREGGVDFIETDNADWVFHPSGNDDLAVLPLISFLNQTYHQVDFFVTEDMLADKETLKSIKNSAGEHISMGVGDWVYTIGRFQIVEGKLQNNPTVRFGNIAQMPNEPILVGTPGEEMEQEGYIVECHSISGYSGAPVFVYFNGMEPRPDSTSLTTSSASLLLGIDCGHLKLREDVLEKTDEEDPKTKLPVYSPKEDLKVLANSAMMVVVPAWKLKELLYEDRFVEDRKELDYKTKKEMPKISEEDVATPDNMPITKEEFEETLKKVSRKKEPSDSESDPSKTKT